MNKWKRGSIARTGMALGVLNWDPTTQFFSTGASTQFVQNLKFTLKVWPHAWMDCYNLHRPLQNDTFRSDNTLSLYKCSLFRVLESSWSNFVVHMSINLQFLPSQHPFFVYAHYFGCYKILGQTLWSTWASTSNFFQAYLWRQSAKGKNVYKIARI